MRELSFFRIADHEPDTRGASGRCSFCDQHAHYSMLSEGKLYALCVHHVLEHLDPAITFSISSDSGDGEYQISYGSDTEPWFCGCPSFKFSRSLPVGAPHEDLKAANGWCKHLERKRIEGAIRLDVEHRIEESVAGTDHA